MSDYTPTTEQIISKYASEWDIYSVHLRIAEFYRWQAEIIRKAKHEAWEQGYVSGVVSIITGAPDNPYLL